MKIFVELHGVLRRLAGAEQLPVEVPDGATVGEALNHLPGPAEFLRRLENCACAMGDQLVSRSQSLAEGDALVLIPPVSGG